LVVENNEAGKLKQFDVEGYDFSTKGSIKDINSHLNAANFTNLVNCMSICNESKLIYNNDKK